MSLVDLVPQEAGIWRTVLTKQEEDSTLELYRKLREVTVTPSPSHV